MHVKNCAIFFFSGPTILADAFTLVSRKLCPSFFSRYTTAFNILNRRLLKRLHGNDLFISYEFILIIVSIAQRWSTKMAE